MDDERIGYLLIKMILVLSVGAKWVSVFSCVGMDFSLVNGQKNGGEEKVFVAQVFEFSDAVYAIKIGIRPGRVFSGNWSAK